MPDRLPGRLPDLFPRVRRRSRWVLPALLSGIVVLVAGAGAGAALESDTVGSFGQGLLWAVTLMTTAGFVHGPPETVPGTVLAVGLMIAGFLMLSLISAALAAILVRDDTETTERREESREAEVVAHLERLHRRLDELERRLGNKAD